MFNKDENKSTNGSQAQSPSLNMISEGTKLTGKLNSQSDIRIAGKIDGESISKGKLIITSTGIVQGNVKAADADIAGRIEGEIRVSNKLILRQSAIIDGDVFTKTLIVEEGAQINGACRMGEESKNLKASADSEFEKATKLKSGE